MADKLTCSMQRDAILGASILFSDLFGIIPPSGIAELFLFDAGTVRNLVKDHQEFFSIKQRYPIIAQPTDLLRQVGPPYACLYLNELVRRVETSLFKAIKMQKASPGKVRIITEETIERARLFLQRFRK
jgi:hypothetical protein